MSKCYYVECNDSFINFKALQEVLQGRIPKDLTVKVEEYDPSEGQGGCFYIEKMRHAEFMFSRKAEVLW